MVFQFLGRPDIADRSSPPINYFLIAIRVNLIALLFLVFGIKIFAMAQKVVMGLAMIGGLTILIVLSITSHAAFVNAWNSMAAQYDSLNFNAFLTAAKIDHGSRRNKASHHMELV